VNIKTDAAGASSAARLAASTPEIPGSLTSMITTSAGKSRMRRSAASPLAAAATSKPSRFKSARSPLRTRPSLVHHQHPQGAPINAL
jgi:hypothetical protein